MDSFIKKHNVIYGVLLVLIIGITHCNRILGIVCAIILVIFYNNYISYTFEPRKMYKRLEDMITVQEKRLDTESKQQYYKMVAPDRISIEKKLQAKDSSKIPVEEPSKYSRETLQAYESSNVYTTYGI